MEFRLLLSAFCVVLILVCAGWLIYNTWTERRRIAQMACDQQWRVFISRVKERLYLIDGVEPDEILHRHAEWFHSLWRTTRTISPAAAVEKWLAEKTTRGSR
jgi:hypothetical protein